MIFQRLVVINTVLSYGTFNSGMGLLGDDMIANQGRCVEQT